ncbi:ABC transporter permease, partial [Streptococcus pneumoniae]
GEISFSNIGMLLAWVLVLGIANLFVLKNSYKAR